MQFSWPTDDPLMTQFWSDNFVKNNAVSLGEWNTVIVTGRKIIWGYISARNCNTRMLLCCRKTKNMHAIYTSLANIVVIWSRAVFLDFLKFLQYVFKTLTLLCSHCDIMYVLFTADNVFSHQFVTNDPLWCVLVLNLLT